MSWHHPTLTTIREEPFKNYRSRTSEKWKAKEHKIEEAKKEKSRRSKEAVMNGMMQTGNHILVMATTNDLDFVFIFILTTVELGPNAGAF